MGIYAFSGCVGLTAIDLPDTVQNLGAGVFAGCALSSFSIPALITSLPDFCFKNCGNLTEYAFPFQIIGIGANVFEGTDINTLRIPERITALDDDAFTGMGEDTILYFETDLRPLDLVTELPCYFGVDVVLRTADFEYLVLDSKLTLTRRLNENGVIPEVIDGASVEALGNRLFADFEGETVAIPQYVRDIHENCFLNSQITSIVLPSNVKTIGEGAFKGCNSLAEMTLPFVGQSVYKVIGNTTTRPEEEYMRYFGYIFGYVVERSRDLTPAENIGGIVQYTKPSSLNDKFYTHYHYFIPNSIVKVTVIIDGYTRIPNYAFKDCSSLTSVKIVGGSSLGAQSFMNCTSLSEVEILGGSMLSDEGTNNYATFSLCPIKKLTIKYTSAFSPSTLYLLDGAGYLGGDNVTVRNYSLEELIVAEGSTSFPSYAAAYCLGLKEVTFPDNLKYIGTGSFLNCTGIKEITLPITVESIGDSAFKGCGNLQRVRFTADTGYRLKTIGYASFDGCSDLDYFYVPSSVTDDIGNSAFEGCKETTVLFQNSDYVPKNTGLIYWDGSEKLNNSPADIRGKIFDSVLKHENGVAFFIKDNRAIVLGYYGEETELTIPSTLDGKPVVKIFDYAFDKRQIESVALSSQITEIGERAFYKNTALTAVTFNNGLVKIGKEAFYTCGLLSVTMPQTLTEIGENAFARNENLSVADFSLTAALRTTGKTSFNGCAALKTLTLSSSIQRIGQGSFGGCGFESLDFIQSKLIELEANAFRDCTSLSDIALPPTLIKIYANCFSSCVNLESVNLDSLDYLISLGVGAFYDCKLLSEENGVIYAGKYAVDCLETGITGFRSDTVGIADRAFYGKSAVTSVTLPSLLKFIGSNAFSQTGVSFEAIGSVNYLSDTSGKRWAFSLNDTNIYNGDLTFDASTVGIADSAFFNDTRINSVTIPASVRTIGNEAFFKAKLSGIAFEDGCQLKYLGNDAFWSCTSLVNIGYVYNASNRINLPEHLTVIGSRAFFDAPSTKTLTIYVSDEIRAIGFAPFKNSTVYNYKSIQFGSTLSELQAFAPYDFLWKNNDGDSISVQYDLTFAYPEP